jgi:hypothetical protein
MPCDLRDKGVRPASDGCGKHAAVLRIVRHRRVQRLVAGHAGVLKRHVQARDPSFRPELSLLCRY